MTETITKYETNWSNCTALSVLQIRKKCQMSFHKISNASINLYRRGLSWSWSYGSWIYNYMCNQCFSTLTLWVWIPFRRGVQHYMLTFVILWLAGGLWLSSGTPVSSTNKTDRHEIIAIMLKVMLNTITLILYFFMYQVE